ncbi:UNVERIFIED_CONTAM: hypothetical protein Slati_2683100 [Sesamum latifolium]|uniref:DUF4218 domain-containing protein n=1 Tax=Sesamum latifolium TaxID=2727402 RepID=A0AAW2VWE3_9LAMI
MKGFMPEYYNLTSHGEERVQEYFEAITAPPLQDEGTSTQLGYATQINCAQRMVLNAVGPAFCSSTYSQDYAPDDDRFHDVLHAIEQPLWNGCTTSQLAAVAELVDIKADGHISQRIYDRISQWGDHIMPCDHTLPLDYYNTKKLIKDLGLPMEKIDACKNSCMLYWKDDIDLDYCKFCRMARYKPTRVRNPNGKKTPYAVLRYLPIIPRLQRLYVSKTTAEQMTWHATYQTEEGSMVHPSDAEAWRHFDRTHPDFAAEPHPSNRKRLIDIYLEPLIKELQNLWHVGVQTRDNAKDETFTMRAALMWTVNDLPAYGMTSGWSTTGVMECPVCMEDTHAFYLQNGEQIRDWVEEFSVVVEAPLSHPDGYGSEHKWTKKSIFWEHEYWSTHLIRHNLDVMDIEKNVFDNIFNTVMDIKGKTKDNLNARKDLQIICNRPELEVDEMRPYVMPKAVYILTRDQKKRIFEWITSLKFSDGYASNLSRCVDMANLRLHGMKSHDCHVFMQKLITIAFREMLPESMWGALTEVSLLFQILCSTTLDVNKVQELEDTVPIIMCNLEKKISPSFFDSMEHLIVHLPYEPLVGGPVQYRWMYPFER